MHSYIPHNRQAGRQAGLFCCHTNIQKKVIYNIVIELWKTINKSMGTGIAQETCTALFPLWFFSKNDILKMKNIYIKRKHRKHWKEKIGKIKTKIILILIMPQL